MNQHKQLAKNTVLIGISRIISVGVVFLLLPLMTAMMSTGEYGVFDLVLSYGSLVMMALVFNSDRGAFRFLIDARGDDKKQTDIISSTVALFSPTILSAATASIVVALYLNSTIVAVISMYFVAIAIANIAQQISRGVGRNDVFAVSSILQSLIAAGGIVLSLLVIDGGLLGIFLSYIVASFISAVVSVVWSRSYRYFKSSSANKATQKEILAYSLPLVPSTVSWWVFGAMDRTLIVLILDASANGIYAVANKFSMILTTAGGVFEQSWTESAALAIDKSDRDKFFSNIANQNVRVFGALSILTLAIVMIVFPIFINRQFHEAYVYIPVLVVGGLFNAFVNYYSGVLLAKKRTRAVMNTSIAAALINLVVNLGLIWFIGIWAAAISTAVAFGVLALYRHRDAKQYMTISYEQGIFVKILGVFAIVSMLYYAAYYVPDLTWLNYPNVVLVIVLSYMLNRRLVHKILKYGWGSLRKV